MRFKNPVNNYEETVSAPWVWCILFGPLYFAVEGAWAHFFVSIIFAIFTAGLSWLIYPFFAYDIVKESYLRKGWIQII